MAECWTCGIERANDSLCPSCGKIQPVSKAANYFGLLGLPLKMALDREALERAYREKSRRVHPDRFATASTVERKLALEQTTVLNDAVRTLRDPRKRAEYFLKLSGVSLSGDEAQQVDRSLLLEMFDLQESVDSAKSVRELESISEASQARKQKLILLLIEHFDQNLHAQKDALRAVIELRYLERHLEQLEAKIERAVETA